MEEQEIDLIDYVNVVLKRKWVIVVGTLVCAVLAVIYNGRQKEAPPVYEARSTLLILPPLFKSELKLFSFSTGVYQTLAKAQDLEQAIIDSLRLKDAGGERLRISALDGALQTQSGAQQGSGSSMDLIVTSSDTVRMSPAKIANVWAALFVRENNGLTTQEAMGNYEFISEQYEIARRNLNAAEDSLNTFEGSRDLPLMQAELEAKNAKLLEYQKSYVNASLELRQQIQDLNDAQVRLAAMETTDGVWVGSMEIEGTDGIDREALSRDQRRMLDMIVQTRDRVRSLRDWIRDFQDENDLEFLAEQLKEKKAKLIVSLQELLNIQVEAASTDLALREIGALPGSQKPLAEVTAGTASGDLLREMASLSLGYNLFDPRKRSLEQELARLKAETDSLENIQQEKQASLVSRTEKLASSREIYDALAAEYTKVKKDVSNLELSINTMRSVTTREEELERLQRETKLLSKEIGTLNLVQVRLTRSLEIYKSTYNKFSNLLEDARVAKANQPGDLKIAARAVEAVQVPSEMPRNVMLLATAMGLVLSVFLAFFLEYVEKAKDRVATGAK